MPGAYYIPSVVIPYLISLSTLTNFATRLPPRVSLDSSTTVGLPVPRTIRRAALSARQAVTRRRTTGARGRRSFRACPRRDPLPRWPPLPRRHPVRRRAPQWWAPPRRWAPPRQRAPQRLAL